MSDWNPDLYLKFSKERARPALDLATRLNGLSPSKILDIGCGPGNSAATLASVFPSASIAGIDSSPAMIAKAKADHPEFEFRVLDVHDLDGSYDLLFSNACLQWVGDHGKLLPFLMGRLNPGGVLAVQMPRNQEEPLYAAIEEEASDPRWNLEERVENILSPADYADILSECSSDFDVWETVYHHRLDDTRQLVEWVKSTRMRPYLEALGDRAGEFEQRIQKRADSEYKRSKAGVLFPFRRLFFTARA